MMQLRNVLPRHYRLPLAKPPAAHHSAPGEPGEGTRHQLNAAPGTPGDKNTKEEERGESNVSRMHDDDEDLFAETRRAAVADEEP